MRNYYSVQIGYVDGIYKSDKRPDPSSNATVAESEVKRYALVAPPLLGYGPYFPNTLTFI